jgi:hypothetical protein
MEEGCEESIQLACDVDNVLYGLKKGSAYILTRKRVHRKNVKDLDEGLDVPGGLGASFFAFLDVQTWLELLQKRQFGSMTLIQDYRNELIYLY